MHGFGTFLIIAGVLGIMVALGMDTSVATASGRVNNLGLMADRQIYILIAAAVLIVGTLLAFLNKVAPAPASIEIDTRACPACAETIKNAAIKCKHCGTAVAPVASTPTTYEPISQALGHGWTVRVSSGGLALAGIQEQLLTLGMPIIGLEKDTVITGPFANERAAMDVSGRIRNTLGIDGSPYWMPPPAA